MRKWDDVTPEGLFNIVEYLKHNFDADLSRRVIELFHERMQDDEHVDPETLYSLMKHVFAQIMEGHSADQAFGLKRKKGEYEREDTYERDMQATAIVVLNIRKGMRWLDAIADASISLDISESTVKRACSEFREGFDLIPDDVLIQLTGASLISP